LLSVAAAFAVACKSSNGAKPTPSAAGTVTVAPSGTAAAATPGAATSPVPAQSPLGPDALTAVAAGADVALADYTDPDGRYVVGLPVGWKQEVGPNFIMTSLPGQPITSVGVFCAPGETIDQLYNEDTNAASNIGKRTTTVNTTRQAVGVQARYVESTTALSSLILRNATYYFEGKDCAWRVQATTAIQGADFRPLLERVIQSFRFTPS